MMYGMEPEIRPDHLKSMWPGATHQEIAEKLGCAPGTVSAWFSRGWIPERGRLLIQVKYPKQIAAVLRR